MIAGPSVKRWKKGHLRDLVFFQRGFDITQAQQTPGPYPVISSSGITSHHSEFKATGPGVVIGRKGTLGSVHFSEGDYWPHDTTLWSKDLRGSNPRFVYYYLHTVNLKRLDVGNSNPTLNRNHIHDLPVLIPPSDVQDRIAGILAGWSCVRPNRRSYAVIWQPASNLIVSTGFAVITPTSLPTSFLYQAVTTDSFAGYLENHARGAAYPAVVAGDFEGAEILVPAKSLVEAFNDFAGALLGQCHNLRLQSQKLRAARDLLLPRLMSGEIAV